MKINCLVLNQIVFVFVVGDQVLADGVVEAEVDFAGFVDEHLVDADLVHVRGEREEEDGRLDGQVCHDQTDEFVETNEKQFRIQTKFSFGPIHF